MQRPFANPAENQLTRIGKGIGIILDHSPCLHDVSNILNANFALKHPLERVDTKDKPLRHRGKFNLFGRETVTRTNQGSLELYRYTMACATAIPPFFDLYSSGLANQFHLIAIRVGDVHCARGNDGVLT